MRRRTAGFEVFNVRTGQIAVPHGEIRDVGRDLEKEEIVFMFGFIHLLVFDISWNMKEERFNY